MTIRAPIFQAVRELARPGLFNDPGNVLALDNLLDAFGVEREGQAKPAPVNAITERIQLEILEHEGIVLEAYKDSVGVWTWGGGVTDRSGHKVARYKNNPKTVTRALEVYEWLLRKTYLPDVLKAFKGHTLSESQLGAALSFHWNTGAILEADWVKHFKSGNQKAAYDAFLHWQKPKEILPRRKLERALFFDGVWSSDGIVNVYTRVKKPSYTPDWSSMTPTDIRPQLRDVVARAGA